MGQGVSAEPSRNVRETKRPIAISVTSFTGDVADDHRHTIPFQPSANTADTSGRVKAPSSVSEGTPDPAMSYGSLDLAMTTPAPETDTPAAVTPDKG